jgi:hypothetical protein
MPKFLYKELKDSVLMLQGLMDVPSKTLSLKLLDVEQAITKEMEKMLTLCPKPQGEEYDSYQANLMLIFNKYAAKRDGKIITDSSGKPMINSPESYNKEINELNAKHPNAKEEAEAYGKRKMKLMEQEVEVEFDQISMEDLPELISANSIKDLRLLKILKA